MDDVPYSQAAVGGEYGEEGGYSVESYETGGGIVAAAGYDESAGGYL